MFFIVRFNSALAALGIDPRHVSPELRHIGQDAGKLAGCTPQEAAIITLGEMPRETHFNARPDAAIGWAAKGKLDLGNPAIKTAIDQIGWYNVFY